MIPPGKSLLAFLSISLVFAGSIFGFEFDDDIPEINDRVARVTYVRGNVQIRRADSEDWERVVTNLPIVEGDEIITDDDSRFEIQFSVYKHFRADERTAVRVVTLKDDGIALSVPQGNVNVRLAEFDINTDFFEIDAPQSTIALQAAGRYRIDAGKPGESTVRISVFDEGEARIYSATSGFTLRGGRTARVFTDGPNTGEWELANSEAFADSFDRWTIERDEDIAENLRDSYYDRYYDRDIYGADELDEYGDWVYTRDYGYVWRPWSSATSSYSDWSPYRYGHWRFIAPFGWTWVNDEPWGWATYHYGRWIWYNGYWHWSPYGYDRFGRSWWRPALVIFTTNRDNYCWYPLPYYSPYYNYNYHYYSRNPRRPRHGQTGGTPTPQPTPPVTPPVSTPILTPEQRRAKMITPPLQTIPPTGVVTVSKDDFGRGRLPIGRPPLATAKEVLAKAPAAGETPPILPTYTDVSKTMRPDVKVDRPVIAKIPISGRTGASDRTDDKPLDNTLKSKRILGNRPPLQINTGQGDVKTTPAGTPDRPKTGAVERPVKPSPPIIVPRSVEDKKPQPVESKPRQTPVFPQQQKREPVDPAPTPKPRQEPPRQYEQPRRVEPPMRRETPRYEPPPQRETPRPSPPPQKSEPPPQKSEPAKPAPTPPLDRKGKDG